VASITNRTRLGAGCPYYAGSRAIPGETDLATVRPDLAADWDHERNGRVKPNAVGARTGRRVWWTGQCGHSWQAAIANRTKGAGCPYCAGKRALPGVTDLATLRPDLAAQWHSRNELRPEYVRPNSRKKVAWQCERGHVWEAAVYARSGAGSGCPFCSGHRVMPGETDLATLHPELAREWDESNAFGPQDVTAGSDRRAKRKCARGHVWDAIISSRTGRRPAGCPCCHGLQAVPGVNDLSTLRPDIAAEWDASNKGSPQLVRPSSTRNAIWRCASGHAWEAPVASRSKGGGCPMCPSTPTKKISQIDRATPTCSEGPESLRG